MITITEKANCTGCYACYNICPQKCICMQSDTEGFWYPVVDMEECAACGLCEKVCPILNHYLDENYPIAYACINQDDKVRRESSSGGMFTAIAESVIANNGVVFGAGFDVNFNVVHSWMDKLDGLGIFRGAKYVQSCTGDTYKQAKNFLKQGRQVLFSGTPCQIAGLKSYLGKNYEGLICLDIICHGVPSPFIWEKYRKETANNRELKSIRFRDKTFGWKNYAVLFEFHNGEITKELGRENKYVQGFLKDYYLRPSCYNCKFKTINRRSDITLADFWGIENILPDFDDDKGTSLIFVNSPKGKTIFLSVTEKIKYKKVEVYQAIAYNASAVKSVNFNSKRDKFFQEVSRTTEISQLLVKYTKVSFIRKSYINLRTRLSLIKRKFCRMNRT